MIRFPSEPFERVGRPIQPRRLLWSGDCGPCGRTLLVFVAGLVRELPDGRGEIECTRCGTTLTVTPADPQEE